MRSPTMEEKLLSLIEDLYQRLEKATAKTRKAEVREEAAETLASLKRELQESQATAIPHHLQERARVAAAYKHL